MGGMDAASVPGSSNGDSNVTITTVCSKVARALKEILTPGRSNDIQSGHIDRHRMPGLRRYVVNRV